YSMITSNILAEKRFVRPLWIEMVTIGILALIYFQSPSVYALVFVDGSFLFFVGKVSDVFARPFVGVQEVGKHQRTVSVNASVEKIIGILKENFAWSPLGLTRSFRLGDSIRMYRNLSPAFFFF